MKTLAITASLIIASMAMWSCGSSDEAKDTKSTNDSTAAVRPSDDGFTAQTNIRYVEQDSLMSAYVFAKETAEKCTQIAAELQNYQNSLGRQLQQKQNAIQQKLQSNGYLNEADYKKDVEELQRLDQSLQAQYAKRAEADNKKVAELTKAVTDSVEHFIIRYNKEKKYDAILYRDAALYFNPQLDITDDIIKGLNAAYKK